MIINGVYISTIGGSCFLRAMKDFYEFKVNNPSFAEKCRNTQQYSIFGKTIVKGVSYDTDFTEFSSDLITLEKYEDCLKRIPNFIKWVFTSAGFCKLLMAFCDVKDIRDGILLALYVEHKGLKSAETIPMEERSSIRSRYWLPSNFEGFEKRLELINNVIKKVELWEESQKLP